MGRRRELKSVCNDLLDSFVSRYNDLGGYWALGKFQAHLLKKQGNRLQFDLACETNGECAFPHTLNYYRQALRRHLKARSLPAEWVADAVICVEQRSSSELNCTFKVTADQGQSFEAQRLVLALRHNPLRELRRYDQHGPQNQRGV